MSRCEFRTSPLPVDGKVMIKDIPCVNNSGQSLILCQALISLAESLNYLPTLPRVVCGLLCSDGNLCPINRHRRGVGALNVREAYADYTGLVNNLVIRSELREKLRAA